MISWTPTPKDFEIIAGWGLDKNPFAAIEDYSELKRELRWLNPEHRRCHDEYVQKRLQYIEYTKNFDHYYKNANKPVDRLHWEYLMARKAWFIMPLGWENISKQSCRVIDVGCGDGDTVQRLIHFIEKAWSKDRVNDRKIEIVGVDLNPSRVENAKNLVRHTHPNISVQFLASDASLASWNYPDKHFDFSLCTGVIEIIDDGKPVETFLDNLCRVTKVGIYIEELADRYPGGIPRMDIDQRLKSRSFKLKHHHFIFTEPFNQFKVSDPMMMWPISVDQNLYLERV